MKIDKSIEHGISFLTKKLKIGVKQKITISVTAKLLHQHSDRKLTKTVLNE